MQTKAKNGTGGSWHYPIHSQTGEWQDVLLEDTQCLAKATLADNWWEGCHHVQQGWNSGKANDQSVNQWITIEQW